MATATMNGGENFGPTAAVEVMSGPPPTRMTTKSASPRFEAFVMTGDKILRLNSKISPNFAFLKQSELPEHTEILESPLYEAEEPEMEHQVMSKWPYRRQQLEKERMRAAVPNSKSENTISQPAALSIASDGQQVDSTDEDSRASCATVNAMCPGGPNIRLKPTESSDLPSPVSPFSQSEPVSPARIAVRTELAQQNKSQDRSVPLIKRFDEDDRLHQLTHSVGGSEQQPVSTSSSTPSVSKAISPRCRASESGSSGPTFPKETDVRAASRLAKRLYNLEGFRPSDVSAHLTKHNEFSALVAREYLQQFNFSGLRLDAALRQFLAQFCLVGETSERERIIAFFAHRYHGCNPVVFKSEDDVHTLAFALLLLNSDLHGSSVTRKMNCREFIDNICQSESAGLSRDVERLKALYNSIKKTPLQNDSSSSSHLSVAENQTDERFLEIPDPESQVEYHKGWVMRKSLVEADGTRTPRGRRGWKMFYATLKGVVLYLHKDEHGFRHGAYQTFQNAVRVHHSLATKALDYHKKQHVLRLQTASLAEYLFQTSDPEQLQLWIDSINLVAACFSCPPLPAPVSFSQKFHRPVLPSGVSKMTMREQLREHQKRTQEIQGLLEQHRENLPPRTAKPRELQEFAEMEVYYQLEIRRYRTYEQVLLAKAVSLDLSDPDCLELTLVNVDGEDSPQIRRPPATDRSEKSAAGGDSDRCSYKIAIYSSDSEAASSNPALSSYETAF